MNNDISELRQHLFDTLRGLKEGTVKIETAKAINDTAQTIINSAKVEVDFMEVAGGKGSGFIPIDRPRQAPGQPPRIPTLAEQAAGAAGKGAPSDD